MLSSLFKYDFDGGELTRGNYLSLYDVKIPGYRYT